MKRDPVFEKNLRRARAVGQKEPHWTIEETTLGTFVIVFANGYRSLLEYPSASAALDMINRLDSEGLSPCYAQVYLEPYRRAA